MNQQDLWQNPLYAALKAAGITITQHAEDPSIGWFFTCPVAQYGPFQTPEQALTQALTQMFANQADDLHAQADKHQANDRRDALSLAIEVMERDKIDDAYLAKAWEQHGERLAFRKEESRNAAWRHNRIDAAIKTLQTLMPK